MVLIGMRIVKGSKNKGRTYKNHNIKKGGSQKVFHFHNRFHYGDNLLNLKFIFNISNILKERGIKIHYYYDNVYIKDKSELECYMNPSVVSLHPLSEMPPESIELWMGHDVDGIKHTDIYNYYSAFYKKILSHLGLQGLNIDTSLFQKESYLLDIYDKLDPKFKNVDVLFFNNPPASQQFDYDKSNFDMLAERLSTKFKVVVLKPVNNLPSTNTDGLKLQQIGAISTHAKYIIGGDTGALVPCFNTDTKKHVKKWIILSKGGVNFGDVPIHLLKNGANIKTANTHI
jgi:hypothetical protein